MTEPDERAVEKMDAILRRKKNDRPIVVEDMVNIILKWSGSRFKGYSQLISLTLSLEFEARLRFLFFTHWVKHSICNYQRV
jgi:hypothetical protein